MDWPALWALVLFVIFLIWRSACLEDENRELRKQVEELDEQLKIGGTD